MGLEETARFIEEELVQVRLDPMRRRAAKRIGDRLKRRSDNRRLPCGIADDKLVWVELPGATHGRIHNRGLAQSKGRLLRLKDDLLHLGANSTAGSLEDEGVGTNGTVH